MERANLLGKRYAVVGLGARTGVSLVKYLCSRGAQVSAYDSKEKRELSASLSALRGLNFDLQAGPAWKDIENSDAVLVSPGVPIDAPALQGAIRRGIPVLSEIEFASRQISAPMIAITGTNGKSTTTSMVAHIFQAWGKKVFAGGNLGTPLIDAAEKDFDFAVVEVSSFQLEAVDEFHPKVGMLLNLSPNHLDRHKSMEVYAALKARLFARMDENDVAIFNGDDPACLNIAKQIRAKTLFFSSGANSKADVVIEGDRLKMKSGQLSLSKLSLPGSHNRENAAAAAAAAHACGCPLDLIEKAFGTFAGLPHRLERVGEWNGVLFVNDSKSTSPDATEKAVRSFVRPVVLLAGGLPKGASYESLSSVRDRIKKAILFGPAGANMVSAFSPDQVIRATGMKDAVNRAMESSERGDVVLLSPANSSFDEFVDYEERGEVFKSYVKERFRGKRSK
jgi:UDP-N-acetylmuramoylalanine--D-glutamate ligase